MPRAVVFLVSRTNGFNVRLAVALYTLRRHEPELPVVILHSDNDVDVGQLRAIADTFNGSLENIGRVDERRRKSLLLKTRINEMLDPDGKRAPTTWLYCDCDVHFEASPAPLFALAKKYGFVVTQMCNWTIGHRKIRGRVRPWLDEGIFDKAFFLARQGMPAVNSGVFAWQPATQPSVAIWHCWYPLTSDGVERFGGGHCVDEYPLNLLAIERNAHIVGSEWNAYGKYHPYWTEVKIYHHAGSKHFRKEWWVVDSWTPDSGCAKIPSSMRWCDAYDRMREGHGELVSQLTHDRHTLDYLRLTGRAP